MTHNDCGPVTFSDLIGYLTESLDERTQRERAEVAERQTGILREVRAELDRQLDKWGVQNRTLVEWVSIEQEEFGEAATDTNKAYFDAQNLQDDAVAGTLDELEDHVRRAGAIAEHIALARQEWVQVAAVAVAAIENIDRREAMASVYKDALDELLPVVRELWAETRA